MANRISNTRALDLIASGYRAVSNRYRIVARIDREDWREEMARRHVAGFSGIPKRISKKRRLSG